MNVFYCPDLSENNFSLSLEESKHCIKVLRHKKDDEIYVCNGDGKLVVAKILDANHKSTNCQYSKDISPTSTKKHRIHIVIAPTKNMDRIEWFVEKCCEMGIDEISFIQTEHSERKVLKIDRLEKKAISAMKQSKSFRLARINELETVKKVIPSLEADQKFIAYVDNDNPDTLKKLVDPEKSYCVLIGPEGDFSPTEVKSAREAGFIPISLGQNVLRTETAGVIACHSLNFINDY